MIADLQSERMDEQRAMLPGLVNRRGVGANNFAANAPAQPDDAFLDMLMRCQVRRLENLVTNDSKVTKFMVAEYPTGGTTIRIAHIQYYDGR